MTEPSKQSGGDPIGDLQRWLVRSGARSVTRQLGGQIRTALGGGGKQSNADVWETATSDYDESPECAWCPICRARRRLRESGPGLGSGVAAAADAVGVVMQDAMSAFEAAVAAAGRQTRPRDNTAQPPGEVWDEATDEPAVRTRPPANGSTSRPAGPRPTSAAWPRHPSAGSKHPPAEATQPPAEAEQPPAEATQPSAETKQSPAEAKQPSAEAGQAPAEAKQPPAGSKQSSADAKPAAGKANQSSAGAKKPADGTKKPTARAGGSAAADRTPPDEPPAAKPDKPTA